MIQLEALYPLSTRKEGWLGHFPQLSPVNECLQHIRLDVAVVVDDL